MTDRQALGWPARFEGVIVAAATPFLAGGGVDVASIPRYVDFLIGGGADALMVGGTTGEFISMDLDERSSAAATFVAAAAGRVPVIVHAGHVDSSRAQVLAERGAAAGADGLAAITPYFHRSGAAAIEAHFRRIARTVPELPFFVYNYPAAAANPLPFSVFEALLDEPNVAGAKLSVGTWEEVEPYLALRAELLIACGNDALMERFLAAGGRVVVSGNAAALPEVVAAAFAGLRGGGDVAAHRAALDSLTRLSHAGAADRLKQLLRLRGLGIGPARVRTFIEPSGDEDRETRQTLDRLLARSPGRAR